MNYLILYYILSTILYIAFGESHVYWFLFNMVSVLFTVVGLLYNFGYKVNFYKPYFNIAIVMTICRIAYSFACVVAPITWVYEGNIIFSVIFSTWMLITTITRYRGT